MQKLDNNTLRALRSLIQDLIIKAQRSGVTFSEIDFPPVPDMPDKIALSEALERAREMRKSNEQAESASVSDDENQQKKMTIREALHIALSMRRQAKEDRRIIRLIHKLTCKGKVVRNNVERRISLERISAYDTVISLLDLYTDEEQGCYSPAGGTVTTPIPMHQE